MCFIKMLRHTGVAHPGRSGHRLTGDATADLLLDYRDLSIDTWRSDDLPRLRQFPINEMATVAGLSERRLRDIYAGRATPRQATKEHLRHAIADMQSSS